MKALSIRQPWCWAILNAGKRVENRDWRGPPSFRGVFLLHAAKGCTLDEFEDGVFAIEQARGGPTLPIPPLGSMPRGAIVGRATIFHGGVVRTHSDGHRVGPGPNCQLCGLPVWNQEQCQKPDPWAVPETLGLVLADVERLVEPIQFKGALGFFDVPDDLLAGAAWEPCP